jgi:hypothetical protein
METPQRPICPACSNRKSRREHCARCRRTGYVDGCNTCAGTGLVPDAAKTYGVKECPKCGGNGCQPPPPIFPFGEHAPAEAK